MADNPRIDELRRRLDKDPGSRLFAQLAEELRKDGDLDEAIRVARAGLAHHPNYPSARMTLGHALMDTGDLRSARVEFETVLRGAPDNILASRYLGECLEGLGDLGSALLQYRATLRLAPGDKNVEGLIRTLEERLSAPSARRAPAASALPARPPAAAAPGRPPEAAVTAAARSDIPAPPAPIAADALNVPPTPSALPVAAAPLVVEESFDLEAPFAPPAGGWPTAQPARFEADLERRVTLTPEPEPAPAPETTSAASLAEAPALSSSTLAELYYKQGFPEKALEVYRELIGREPENERARARLREIAAITGTSSEAAAGGTNPREARRRAIERTITRLEGLLAVIREGGG